MDEAEVDFKTCFPNLIIFLGPKKNSNLFKELKKSFTEFKYGNLYTHMGQRDVDKRTVRICRIMQQDPFTTRCLAVGQGNSPTDAEKQALEKFMKKLCDLCYVIQANRHYLSISPKKKSIPLNGDPSLRHIYKIVFLKNNSRGLPFPSGLSVSGLIDYVQDYKELEDYILAHGDSESKADLFILGLLKSDRTRIRDVCQTCKLTMLPLIGCSDMGVFAFRNKPTREILQDLLEAGGETIKYKLIGPQDHQFGDSNIKVNKEEFSGQSEDATEVEEEIVISPWIAERLIIMEIVNESSELQSPRQIIFISVKACPDTEKFIVEKKNDKLNMFHTEALIDMNVVGRAKGFDITEAKRAAAEDAMKNLKKCCYYIEAKKSYFGSSTIVPPFLKLPNPVKVTKTYRIVDNTNKSHDKILKDFSFSRQEDLFFLQDYFTIEERLRIENLAKSKQFLCRWIGREHILCVYKRKNFKDILQELMSTFSKENEKYKLIIPPNHHLASPSDQHLGGRATESELDVKPSSTPQHKPSDGVPQEAEPSAQEGDKEDDPPSWVMKFIQSAPEKQVNPYAYNKKPAKPIQYLPKGSHDVYKRFRFDAPKYVPPPSLPPTMFQKIHETPEQRADTEPYKPTAAPQHNFTHNDPINKPTNYPPSISERLGKMLSTQNQTKLEEYSQKPSNSGFHQQSGRWDNVRGNSSQEQRNISSDHTRSVTDNGGNKRRYDGFRGEGESTNKFSRLNANPRSSECESSYDKLIWEEEERSPEEFTESKVFPTPVNTLQHTDPYGGRPRIKVVEEFCEDTSRFFDIRPESSQSQNPSNLWDGNIKQEYDQKTNKPTGGKRNFTHLFDGVGSEGPSRGSFSFVPPAPWKTKQNKKRGHSFSKLQKYCGKSRPY